MREKVSETVPAVSGTRGGACAFASADMSGPGGEDMLRFGNGV